VPRRQIGGVALAVAVMALLLPSCAGSLVLPAGMFMLLTFGAAMLAGCTSREVVDGGAPDAPGHFESCCEQGRMSSCYCPPSTACNFGMAVTFCSDGTCFTTGMGSCPTIDAGAPDAAGTFEPCCVDEHVSTCYCPPGAVCNFTLGVTNCGDGTCFVGFGDAGSCVAPDAHP
jgi:hypothetical protein